MEQLLSSSFDLLGSYDPIYVRKGLRCLEGLLAKMCLPPTSSTATTFKKHSVVPARPVVDAPLKEFLRLQNGFEWNVTLRLISCLERLLGRTSSSHTSTLITQTLSLIQGLLLLHPASRKLFARESHMNVLLDVLESPFSHDIHSATLLTLVCALLENPANTRTFEALNGLSTVTRLFKSRKTSREVKMRILEFLYFYLMPEGSAAVNPKTGKPALKDAARHLNERTSEDKQRMLGLYLRNVESLARDLREAAPFGIMS